ncbi:hypothetical protein [Ensifer aridi]|uniref:hypothetical protein n=1 Tax=Ensifer aridi TaxID=1708715 RepID=UPI000A0FBAD0|nr:hypothetical protein [Ensifer aridi]
METISIRKKIGARDVLLAEGELQEQTFREFLDLYRQSMADDTFLVFSKDRHLFVITKPEAKRMLQLSNKVRWKHFKERFDATEPPVAA